MDPGELARAQREVDHRKPSLTLSLLQPADTRLVPVQPQFLQQLSDHLGDHLTSADGFDAILFDPLTAIDPDAASVDSLSDSSVDVAALPGAFTPDSLDSIGRDMVTFGSNGDTIVQIFGLGSEPPPPPPADTSGFKNTGDDGSGDGGSGNGGLGGIRDYPGNEVGL